MKLIAVEGNRLSLDGGAMFGNAPKALWSKWTESDSQNRIPLASRCLLVQKDSGENILFETGTGSFFNPALKERFAIKESENVLIKNLASLGLKESDIDGIVLSHLHFDHAGGLLSAYREDDENHLLFPKAKYYVSEQHWEMTQKIHLREKASFIPQLNQLLKNSERLVLIKDTFFKDLDFVVFHYSQGHTVGLMISEIQIDSAPIVFASDLIPGIPWIHLPVTMGYDRFPELLIDEKLKLFSGLLSKKGKLFFTHDPKISCIELKQDEKGKFYGSPSSL